LREGNSIIGKPEEAKYGLTKDQLDSAYIKALSKGVKRLGIHTMIASNELNPQYFVDTAKMLIEIAVKFSYLYSINLEFMNIGGGIGIPYKPEQKEVDLELVADGIREAYSRFSARKVPMPRLFMECGRLITGPHGYLVSTVRHVTQKYRNYVGLDSCMANLMRPALYGSYHHITVMGKEDKPRDHVYDVTGSLCENNDKFAINRELPLVEPGDTLVIHDAGAHGYAMGFQYNGKLRCAEFLLTEKGEFKMIRRAETISDYLSTFNFEGSRFSSKDPKH
jgi:diaminopimelate decarboxylase